MRASYFPSLPQHPKSLGLKTQELLKVSQEEGGRGGERMN